ncbi:secreted RxLR effector protein 78-like [Beta vulgaris subsp. vulgaris]|uniref:secreted RxLR effector protein 78-like n=1 Tax=Beta vulgaris subsp. vulgaris TaxID=3555 RepID=UPI0025480894|nr:secreted RxLR effector protein 78-like [Beta vulgaris subsp. vulgaris]
MIQDNVLLAHEVFHSFKNKKGTSGWLAIKLDMEKAYDRLEWNYIFTTLEKLGFCDRWIEWLRQCISTVSFSVLVNGIPGETFVPQRGIRQGDPLSPYIFILCAEMLARQLQNASLAGTRSLGVTLGHSRVKIPFLTFADDTMIFAKASEESCYT